MQTSILISVLCFVHAQSRLKKKNRTKIEQKFTTKDFVEFHNHSPLLTMLIRNKSDNSPWAGFEPTSPHTLDECDNHYTIRTTMLATWQSTMWFCVVWNEVYREIFFQGDRVGEPITPIWNPTKDQVNDARPKSTWRKTKEDPQGIQANFKLIIRNMRETLTLYTPNNDIFRLNKCLKENSPCAGFEPTSTPSPPTLVGCDNHYTIRTTMLATQQSTMWFYVVWNEVSREIFFQGDRVGVPTKDQVNDAPTYTIWWLYSTTSTNKNSNHHILFVIAV